MGISRDSESNQAILKSADESVTPRKEEPRQQVIGCVDEGLDSCVLINLKDAFSHQLEANLEAILNLRRGLMRKEEPRVYEVCPCALARKEEPRHHKHPPPTSLPE